MKTRIIDNSHWHPIDDWQAFVSWGPDLLISKATEGVDFLDSALADHARGTYDNQIPFVTFHYLRAASSGIEQYDWWRSNKDYIQHDAGLAILDLEGRGNDGQSAYAFADAIEAFTDQARIDGLQTVGYSNFNFFNNFFKPVVGRISAAFDYIWLSYPSGRPTTSDLLGSKFYPPFPHKDKLVLWQYTWSEAVPGFDSPVDASMWLGDDESFYRFIGLEEIPGPDPDPVIVKVIVPDGVVVEVERVDNDDR